MTYLAYQLQSDLLAPVRFAADAMRASLDRLAPWDPTLATRSLGAAYEMVARAGLTHHRPDYGIDTATVGGREVPVIEEIAFQTPFATLRHFKKDVAVAQPRVLLIAALSGHFSTLLRDTVATMLPEHDVFITEWHNARDVPLADGFFGFDDYVAHTMQFLEVLGPGAHVVAVCQPCVQMLAVAALMAQDGHPAQPRSMTLMAGPIDPRINPTEVNLLATTQSIDWFERNLISTVPACYPGAGRQVYPGFMQLTAFVTMNLERHLRAHRDMFWSLALGATDKATKLKTFYDDYFAVLDMTAEFYLETVQWVFQEARLATGSLTWRGNAVEPRAIGRTALLTVEGANDDICGVGQTAAAHDLCTGLDAGMKQHHLQPDVGHYGVFAGSRWENQIYPKVRDLILANA
jgi:polyhydroxyalkanoate depolymerase